MADDKREQEPAKTGETTDHPGEGAKPPGVGPVDKKPEIEQQPT